MSFMIKRSAQTQTPLDRTCRRQDAPILHLSALSSALSSGFSFSGE